VRIYDESDPEESNLLKVLCGGHQNADILAMAYSMHFTMLATASSNGLVAIWDFETGKMDGLLVNQQCEVVGIDFGDPFPVIVVGQSNGMVSVWTIKQASSHARFKCLLRIMNTTFGPLGTTSATPVTSLAVFADYSSGVHRGIWLPEY
jgi:WD40 repeat protein